MTSSRSHLNLNNSLAIRHEIQRFESVHPSIYAIYDLIELIPDQQIAQQIRDHVVCIEDSFVNSQEWTISRTVPDLRLGIVGSLCSGKSALVHRYLTGSYMQEESPEGGRFKKEIFIDGQSYLLLIRDEGGLPEMQFAAWVDAVIFVFSLENEASYNAVSNYFTKLSHFRNSADVPIILVGTQDTISERNPRVINDLRARALANELKRCSYYETCATYGLNVERVFQDACQKIVQQRIANNTAQSLTQTNSRPTTPLGNNTRLGIASYHQPATTPQAQASISSPTNVFPSTIIDTTVVNCNTNNTNNNTQHSSGNLTLPHKNHNSSSASSSGHHNIPVKMSADFIQLEQQQQQTSPIHQKWCTISHGTSKKTLLALATSTADATENNNNNNNNTITLSGSTSNLFPPAVPIQTTTSTTNVSMASTLVGSVGGKSMIPFRDSKDSGSLSSSNNLLINNNSNNGSGNNLTPTSTPTTTRKTRRRSNLFIPSSKKFDDKIKGGVGGGGGELGSGRSIPIKQGYLYKRSSKTLNKEWKKKYVTLCDDGRLTYHPSLHDYMDDVHGKEIILQCCTVKVPGQKPRGTKSILTNSILTAVLGGSHNGNYTNNSPQNNSVASQHNNNNNNNCKSINADGILSLSISGGNNKEKKYTEKVLLTAFDSLRDPMNSISVNSKTNSQQTSADEGIAMSNSNSQTFLTVPPAENCQNIRNEIPQTQYIKKRHRRMKSSSVKNNECDDSDGFEFFIITSDSKQYHFEAPNSEERDDWVSVIHQEISNSIQRNETTKTKQLSAGEVTTSIQMIRTQVAGNGYCVDCEAPNPEWASLNLGILMCIECSGGHRNLGSHISKVRSLDLDDWPPGHLSVMLAIGNTLANSVWEATVRNRTKPSPSSSSEEKQLWIRNKYDGKEFLMSQSKQSVKQLSERLIDAVNRSDMKTLILLLANTSSEHINSTVSLQDLRTPLHLACTNGNLAIAQLLIWHHADINQMDQDGRTCLWYAKEFESFTAFDGGQQAALQQPQQQPQQPQQNSITKYSGETISVLIDLLIGLGCVDRPQSKQSLSGTLPRRRETSSLERLSTNI